MKQGPRGCDITSEICTTDYPHEIKVRYKMVDGWPMVFYYFKINNEDHFFSFYADEFEILSRKFKKISNSIMDDLAEIVRKKFNQDGEKND